MNSDALKLQSLQLSQERGIPLSFWIGLAPNLKATAPRDRIMVKVEVLVLRERIAPEHIHRGRAYALSAVDFMVARQIEYWCEGRLHGMLQLKRAQLRELLQLLAGESRVYWIPKPKELLEWRDGVLPGVHEYLVAPEVVPAKSEKDTSAPKPTGENNTSPPSSAPTLKAESNLQVMTVDGSTNFLAIGLPSRDSVVYEQALELLKSQGFKLEPSNRKWWLRDRHKTLTFLASYWQELKEVYCADFSENFLTRTAELAPIAMNCAIHAEGDDYRMELALQAEGVDESALNAALAQGKTYCETAKGGVALIGQETLRRFSALRERISGNPQAANTPRFSRRIAASEVPFVAELIEESGTHYIAPEAWKSRSRAMLDLSTLEPAPLEPSIHGILRPYQRLGVAWLWHLFKSKLGGVLADEMGLGKTLQSIALIVCIRKTHTQPALVVCPASLVQNWAREIRRFAPELSLTVYHGAQREKDEVQSAAPTVIITSYSTLARDHERFEAMEFSLIISDEAQHIKNRRTQNAQALRRIQAQGRIALTGTPIENSLEDLRSLFLFLMPGFLQTPSGTLKREARAWQDQRLREQVAPYILRRTKKDVAPELPDKIQQTLFCEMSSEQAQLYQKIQHQGRKAVSKLEMSGASESAVRLATLNQLLRLRQVCAEPRIVDDSLSAEHSAKLRAFMELLEEARDGGHRMLVFSQFVTVLQWIARELEEEGIPFAYLDGKTRDRLAECDRFNESDIPVFLISLKAGGTGLNLTGADTVVHFDPWWNPAAEAQATDRAHRIGQSKVVTVIKLIVSGTVEETVLELQKRKTHLIDELFEASEENSASLELSELKSLI